MSKKKSTKANKGAKVVGSYKKIVKYTCPIRGPVEQEVEVKLYEGQEATEDRLVDPDIAELLGSEMRELEDAGFHEEFLN